MNEELEKQINDLIKRVGNLEKSPTIADHFHNGFDVSRIQNSDIAGRKFWITYTLYGATAATAANYGTFFINRIAPCYVSAFYENHQVAGSDAGAVTVMLEKMTGTEAPDAGDAILAAALSLKATANTIQTGILTNTLLYRNLALGDRLGLKDAGTLTNVSNVTVFVELTLT